MTRDDAISILDELKNSRNMFNHAIAAGKVMAALYTYLEGQGKNPELGQDDWEIVGMLHDADYEATGKSLELHTEETTKKLKEVGAQEIIIDAIRGHCDKAQRDTLMAKAIYACDELSGLIVACALVQPEKKLSSVSLESLLKKFKNKTFAAGANRDQIKTCETELEIPIENFAKIALEAMQANAKELGL